MTAPRGTEEAEREALAVFGPDGALARIMPGFEYRPEQVRMAAFVHRAFAAGRTALIEAGTGTGKSLAYLHPGLQHARRTGRPLVVSTNTINLQEQLLEKDLAVLAALDPANPPRAALLLGRGNYLCRRRLQLVLDRGLLDAPDDLLAALAQAASAGRGERNALGFAVSEEVWAPVRSEAEFCLRARCPWAAGCHWLAARKAASEAEIILVNHHLLLADAAVRRTLGWEAEAAVLPAYTFAVIDEAHHLEDIATGYFSVRLGSLALTRALDRLFRREGPSQQGVLPLFSLGLRTAGQSLPAARAGEARAAAERAIAAVEEARRRAERFFAPLLNLARAGRAEGNSCQLRYRDDLRRLAPELGPAAEDLGLSLEDLRRILGKLLECWEGENADSPETEEGLVVRSARVQLAEFCADLPRVLAAEDGDSVYWLETSRHRGGEEVEAVAAPLRVGPVLHQAFLVNLEAAVFASATLTAGGDFAYFRERLGLDLVSPGVRMELVLESPYDYRRQVLLGLPSDLPEPDDPAFPAAAAAFLGELIGIAGGRTLVLFTSFSALDRVCDLLEGRLPSGLRLLRQGRRPRAELLAEFRRMDGAVLCGTDSFWEGVDVPGVALSCVIVARLPFRVPTEPVVEARMEMIEREGGSAFYRYSLPQAAIRLKQGFGRLVRRGDDDGAVVILDRRILTKSYGVVFRQALPPCTEVRGSRDEVLAAVRGWLERRDGKKRHGA